MNDKIDVLYVKNPKHILAAVTRNADPTSKIEAEDVARAGLLVRGFGTTTGNEQFEVRPEDLEIATVDFDSGIFFRPRAYSFEDGKAILTPTGLTVSSVTLTSTLVTVTVSPAVTEEAKVWVQVESSTLEEPLVVEGKIPISATSAILQIATLDPGTYFILTLVAGRVPHAQTQTIP